MTCTRRSPDCCRAGWEALRRADGPLSRFRPAGRWVGAGMGSLATAARLAAQGHRVAVYERAATYGGGVGRFEREGFAFDTGPGLLHLPAVYRDLFVKTGKGIAKDERTLEQSVELTQ